MVPIGQLLRRTARIVRDLARQFGKQVEVEFIGEDTEVDKTIAEELADPLMHIIRNAIDHGIELPQERLAAGKNAVAKICLSASHEGSQIVVQVSDDGRGLDRAKILQKAREKNLVSDEHLADGDIVDLIFQPGFSTADKITTVSGRGVGMDVVRRHVEKLRGRVDVDSSPGEGTRFAIRLPLTRAIIDGLVVKVGDSRYVIPLGSVREIFRPAEAAISTVQARGELVLLHNRLLPILRLHREFSIASAITDPWAAVLIVAESDGRQFCLMVDELIGKQEVVVKSLGHFLNSTPGVSGGTILGDGRVGLILDVQQIEVRA
jgi:two-component system chemotaxis sensor kinase CheA